MFSFKHTYTLSFEIHSNHEEGKDLTGLDLRRALLDRLDDLSDNDMLKVCKLAATVELSAEKNA